MQYIYTTSIFFDTNNVVGVDPATEALNITDFVTNYKAQTLSIDRLSLIDTYVEIVKTYSAFKVLIVDDITWGDVKMYTNKNHYDLYLFTEQPI